MSENKTSGVRADLSPSEFKSKMDQVAPKKSNKGSKIKDFFVKFTDILSSFGLFPVLNSKANNRSHGHVGGCYNHSSNSFRESYRVDQTPRRRTHEDMVREHIAHDAYMDMVDGKGDNEK